MGPIQLRDEEREVQEAGKPRSPKPGLLCRIFGHKFVCAPCGEPIDSECRGRGLRCTRCPVTRPPLPPLARHVTEDFVREIWRHVRNCNSCVGGAIAYGHCAWMKQLYASFTAPERRAP